MTQAHRHCASSVTDLIIISILITSAQEPEYQFQRSLPYERVCQLSKNVKKIRLLSSAAS